MGNSRVFGVCLMIFGAMVATDGAMMKPFRLWSIGIGVFFILVGLRYFLRARAAAAKPPAT
jgi:ABC-type enterobactin transport system permease subunit